MAFSLIDPDFAKDQLELLLKETYLHPGGQIPAYEWSFGDANPPVHALGALQAFRTERARRGRGDRAFLKRAFHKLLLNYAWWIGAKDANGLNVFEGGFLGLDNISVFDRSMRLPEGYKLKQSDATGRDEWALHAPALKNVEDAVEVRRRLLLAFERAEAEEDAGKRHALLTFLIVGGGPTGVELAGAIADGALRHGPGIPPLRSRLGAGDPGAIGLAHSADLSRKLI
jgi:hypothetical protein